MLSQGYKEGALYNRIYGKKMMELKYRKWDDVSIALYRKILGVTNDEALNEAEKNIAVLALLCDVPEDDIYNMAVDDVRTLLGQMDWLLSFDFNSKYELRKVMVGKTECGVELDVNKMSIAQYIDFQQSYKGGVNADNMAQILACFFIPKGHKYGDGYDVVEFIDEIDNKVPITIANSACFFFLQQSASSIKALKLYLAWQMRKMKRKAKRKKEAEIVQRIEALKEQMDNLYGYL